MRRRASLVVWALAREAVSWRRERGGISAGVGGAAVDAVGAVEGLVVVRPEMEERQWLMRARREVTEDCRRSMSAVRDEGGMLYEAIIICTISFTRITRPSVLKAIHTCDR